MGKKESIDVLVQGGKATPAPPLGPSLSPLKVNVGQVVAQINEKTKEMKRDKLRHKKEEATIEGGDIGFSKILQIAKAKEDVLMSHTMKGKVKQILGTCLSGGVTVDGKDPRAVQKEVDEGKHKVE